MSKAELPSFYIKYFFFVLQATSNSLRLKATSSLTHSFLYSLHCHSCLSLNCTSLKSAISSWMNPVPSEHSSWDYNISVPQYFSPLCSKLCLDFLPSFSYSWSGFLLDILGLILNLFVWLVFVSKPPLWYFMTPQGKYDNA